MAIIDDISKTLADKGKEAAHKARDMAEIVQLRAQMSSEKSRVKSLYGAIGQLYYKNHRDDTDGEYQTIVNEITESLARAAELQNRIRRLDGSVVCPSCGAVIRKGNAFCGKCGAAAPAVKKEAEEDAAETAAEEAVVDEAVADEDPAEAAAEEAVVDEGPVEAETCEVEEEIAADAAEEAAAEETGEKLS